MKIPLFKPYLGEEELNALKEIFATGWIGLGPKTAEFERQFSEYLDVKTCVGTNSATSALDLALKIFDFPSGEVLVPAITFASTAQVVDYSPQLAVKFVDVDKETLCIDVNDLENKINENTRAVIPVHMGGHACDMDLIGDIINRQSQDIIIIEDCAHCLGGEYKGRKLGTIGDIGCFSFEAKKNITTGDGGMMATNLEALESKLRRLRWVGMNRDTWRRISDKESYSWYYEINELGYKYNMNDIMAAMGIEQLKKLDKINDRKRHIMKRYNKGLSGLDWLSMPEHYDLEKGAHWLYIIKVKQRDKFVDYMAKNDITTGVHYMPLNLHPYYKRKYPAVLPNSEEVWLGLVSLPLFYELTDEMVDYVIDTVRNFE
jgi:perosamine synthetase